MHNEYDIDRTCHAPTNVTRGRGPRLFQVRVIHADVCRTDEDVYKRQMDVMAKRPKPSNTEPGLIYMLNGATQHSYTDPFDRTSAAIPIGPHWMILWPFDAKAAGLPTVMRDAGTLVMFAGTPYAHLHVSGSPWDGHEYHTGDRGVWTMTYARPHKK